MTPEVIPDVAGLPAQYRISADRVRRPVGSVGGTLDKPHVAGASYSGLAFPFIWNRRWRDVRRQLKNGEVVLVWSELHESVNIMPRGQFRAGQEEI